MSEDERSYFRIRAEQEIRAAQAARHPGAARAHYMMAGYYLDLAHNPGSAAPAPPTSRDRPVRRAMPATHAGQAGIPAASA